MAEYEVTDQQMERIDAAIAGVAGEDLAAAAEGTTLHRFNMAAGLLGLLDATNLGPYRDKTLEAVDRQAYGVLSLRRSTLEALLVRLSETADMRQWFADIRARGLTRSLGSDYVAVVAGYEEFLSGPTFWGRVTGLSEEQRGAVVQREVRKLAVLDPEASQRAGIVLFFREVLRDPIHWFGKQVVTVQEQGWDRFFLLIGEAAKAVNVDDPTAADIIGDLKSGAKGAKGLKAIGETLTDPKWRRVFARHFARHGLHKSFFRAFTRGNLVGLLGDNEDTHKIRVGMKLAERLGWLRQGFPVVTAALAIGGIFATWPPIRPEGGIDLEAALGMGASTLSVASTGADLIGDLAKHLRKRAMKEVTEETIDTAAAAKHLTQQIPAPDGPVSLTRMQKLGRFFKIGGLVGDAIFIGLNLVGVVKEMRNEDHVGGWMLQGAVVAGVLGVVGGAMALSAALAPAAGVLTLLGTVLGAVFAVGGLVFGESDLTGHVRQQLTALGITEDERTVVARLTTGDGGVCSPVLLPMFPWGCLLVDGSRPPEEVRQLVAAAPTAEKVAFINQRLDRRTGRGHEQQVFDTIRYAADGPDFLALLEALDMGRVAAELEEDAQAATVMGLAARAYDAAGRAPGPAFTNQLERHCVDRREGVLERFLADVEDRVLWRVEPTAIGDAVRAYLPQRVNAAESDALVNFLLRLSPEQRNAVMEQGGVALSMQLHGRLQEDAWSRLVVHLMGPEASPRAREIAKAPHVHESATTTWVSNNLFVRHSADQVVDETASASRFDKLARVSGFLEQPFLDRRNMVYELLRAIPIEGGDFRYVVENIHAHRLMNALRDDTEAAEIMLKTLHAYLAESLPPGPAFYAQLEAYCRYQRAGVLEQFIEDVGVANYMTIDPRKLVEGSLMFEYRGVRRQERRVAYLMLHRAHPSQFARMVEIGGPRYVDMVKRSLSAEDRIALEERIRGLEEQGQDRDHQAHQQPVAQ